MVRTRERHFSALVLTCFFLASVTSFGQTAGPEIQGQILDSDGQPQSGVKVELVEVLDNYQRAAVEWQGLDRPTAIATSVSEKNGHFRLPTPRGDLWTVVVRASDSPALVSRPKAILESTNFLSVHLVPSRTTHGQVVDDQGRGVPGAIVTLAPSPPWGQESRQAFRVVSPWIRCDNVGKFSLQRPLKGKIDIRAWSPEHLEVTIEDFQKGGVIPLKKGTTQTVNILETDGSPAKGVLVRIGDEEWPVAMTDADGTVSVLTSPNATTRLRLVTKDGRDQEATLPAPKKKNSSIHTYTLAPPEHFSGRVLDAIHQKPIAGALVWRSKSPGNVTRTDQHGRFTWSGGPLDKREWLHQAAAGFIPKVSIADSAASRQKMEISLTPSVQITGFTLDTQGSPVVGAEITAISKSHNLRRQYRSSAMVLARSNQRGAFVIPGLTPESLYSLKANAFGFAAAHQEIASGKPGGRAPSIRLELDRGHQSFGLVLNDQEMPVAGAKIGMELVPTQTNSRRFWTSRSASTSAPFESFSSSDGVFELLHLTAGKYDLLVTAPGYAPNMVRGIELPPGNEDIDLGTVYLEAGVTLEGLVTDTNAQPLEGVSIRHDTKIANRRSGSFRYRSQEGDSQQQETTEEGRFAISDLSARGQVHLYLKKEGYLSKNLSGVAATIEEPLIIEMEPASEVSGRVEAQDGNPIPRTRIYLTSQGSGTAIGNQVLPRWDNLKTAQSDDNGEFILDDLEEGKYTLAGTHKEYRRGEIPGIEVEAGTTLENLVLTLEPGAAIEGRVLTPTGLPVEGAMIRIKTDNQMFFSFGSSGSSSDSQGHFRLAGLEPGIEQTFEARHEDYGTVDKEHLVRAGEQSLDFIFQPGFSAEGRVVNEEGKAVASARVRLRSSQGSGASRASTTTADGTFRFENLQTGQYWLSSDHQEYASYQANTPIEIVGEPISGIEVRLLRGSAIYGQVIGLEPDQFEQVEIQSFQQGRKQRSSGSTRLDFEGGYRLERLAPGNWIVNARINQGGRAIMGQVTLEAGVEEVRLDLEFDGTLTLSGQVLHLGRPFQGTQVLARNTTRGEFASATTDYQGRFEIAGLVEGSYQISLMNSGRTLQQTETVELLTDETILIEINTSKIRGRVVDALTFEPLANTLVKARAADSGSFASFRQDLAATTDGDGYFSLDWITPGTWNLVAALDGYASEDLALETQEGIDTNDIEIRLSRSEGLTIEVFLPGARPASEVQAALLGPGDSILSAGAYSANSKGQVQISTAPSGTFELLVSARGQGTARLPVTIPNSVVSVQLKLATDLTVTVPELASGATTATITIRDTDQTLYRGFTLGGSVQSEWYLLAGTGKIEALPPGTWTVTATTPNGESWSAQVRLSGQRHQQLVLE